MDKEQIRENWRKECFCTDESLDKPATFACKYNKEAIADYWLNVLDQEIGEERERILEWAKNELEERKKGLEIWKSGENPTEPMEIWGNIWELERVVKFLSESK